MKTNFLDWRVFSYSGNQIKTPVEVSLPPNVLAGTYYYSVRDSKKELSFGDYEKSCSYAGIPNNVELKFEYLLEMQDESTVPDFISLDSEERTVSIQTDSQETEGTYRLLVVAYLAGEEVNRDQAFTLVVRGAVNNPPVWEEELGD